MIGFRPALVHDARTRSILASFTVIKCRGAFVYLIKGRAANLLPALGGFVGSPFLDFFDFFLGFFDFFFGLLERSRQPVDEDCLGVLSRHIIDIELLHLTDDVLGYVHQITQGGLLMMDAGWRGLELDVRLVVPRC